MCVSMECGVVCVRRDGIRLMHMWCVDNWNIQIKVVPENGMSAIKFYCSTEPVLLPNFIIERGIYPIVYSNFSCHPWDNGLAECEKDNYMSLSCPAGNIVGILCVDGEQ